jgi:hypothetical protein
VELLELLVLEDDVLLDELLLLVVLVMCILLTTRAETPPKPSTEATRNQRLNLLASANARGLGIGGVRGFCTAL